MRGEVILLVAGLAVVASLPVQEQALSPQQSDLLKIILSANPEENDLKTIPDEKPSVAPTKMEDQVTHTDMVKEQPVPQPQDPLQPLSQDSPQEQPQAQDTPQEQPQAQDSPQEQPQAQDTSQEQPQLQDPEIDPEEPSLPYESEDEVPSEEAAVWPESQPILVYPQEENIPYESEELEEDELNSDLGMGTFSADDGYEVLQVNEEQPPLDIEGTFMYGLRMTPLPYSHEGESLLSDSEEEYDSDEEAPSFEPQMDSLPFEPQEPQMKPLSVQSQEDFLPYDSEELLDPNPQMEFFPVDEDPLEADYEHLPHEMDDDHDYGFPTVEAQPGWEEDMSSTLENAPIEESYHEPQSDTALDLFSWLVPDFFNEESTDYDESPFVTDYHDDMIDEDPFTNKPEIQFESQVLDRTSNWEEPSASEGFDGTIHSHDSFQDEIVLPHEVDSKEEEDGDVSLADFFIPTYDAQTFTNIPQEYSDADNPEDNSEENYSVDDGLFHVEPALKSYEVDVEQDRSDMKMFGDNILSPKNPSFEDERNTFSWPAEYNEEDQTEYPEEDKPVTILESQPTYVPDVEADMTYPSLQDRMLKGFAGGELVEPWNGGKSLMVDLMSDSDAEDDEILPMERDYSSNILDNDAMDIIIVKDPKGNFDNFPIRPLVDDIITQRHPVPIVRYTEDQRSTPSWVPKRVPDQQFPNIYFSVTDERPRRRIPVFFDRMDEEIPSSPSPSYRSMKTPVMSNPFTFLNEIMDDDLPPQYLASPSTSRRFRYMGPDTLSSPRNYPDTFKTPKFSFRDLLHQLNPSFYDDRHINNMARQSSPYYPQSYNSMQYYNEPPQQFPHISPPVPYSSPFESFQERDYSPVQKYSTNRPQTFSFYSSNNEPSRMFREDTMPEMYSRPPLRHFDDYTHDLPFMSSDSFSSPRPRFPFFQRPRYSANYPVFNRPHYSQNSFYGMGPYYPTPLYPRYAPDYY